MLRTVFLRTSKHVSETLLSAGLFIVTESSFIYSLHRLGLLLSIAIFSIIYGGMSLVLLAWFEREEVASSRMGQITRWIVQKAALLKQRYTHLIASSSWLAILLASVLAGGVVTTIFIRLLGYEGGRAKIYILLQNVFSVAVWALIYSGGLHLLFGHR